MGFGDGRLIAETLQRGLDFVTRYLKGTDGQGSVFLIWGGLVVIGFLATSHAFRTIVLADLAPAANPPRRQPQALTRTRPNPSQAWPGPRVGEDEGTAERLGRLAGLRVGAETLDELLDAFHEAGLGDPRILASRSTSKQIRVDGAPAEPVGAAYGRGFLQGGIEGLVGGHVDVEETEADEETTRIEYVFSYGGGPA